MRVIGRIDDVFGADEIRDERQRLLIGIEEMKKFGDRITSDGLRRRNGTYSGINS